MENIRKTFIKKYGVEKVVFGNGIILDLSEVSFNKNKDSYMFKHHMSGLLNASYRIQGSYAVLSALPCSIHTIGEVFQDRIEISNIHAIYLGIKPHGNYIMHKLLDINGDIHLVRCCWKKR